jgi:hypothetical protein
MIEENEGSQYLYFYSRNGKEFATPSLKVATRQSDANSEVFYQEIIFHD